MIARFGDFHLDTGRRQVTRRGTPIHLTPKAFELLSLLAAEAPRVVPKNELHERLWPGTYVSDATLAGLVKELRRSLASGNPDAPIVRTAHRVGYAFCAELEQEPQGPASWHWLVVRRRRVALRQGENIVGRDPASQVWLDSASVSRRHARIVVNAGGVRVEDLGSKNGTRVADVPATSARTLTDGDRVTFGSIECVYRCSSAGVSTETGVAGRLNGA